jgi:hypothetical protein
MARSGKIRLVNYQQLITRVGGPSKMQMPTRAMTP